MSIPGGGNIDISDLLKRLGPEPLLRELEAQGLVPVRGRIRCPFPGCADKGADGRRNVQVFTEGKPHLYCFSCEATGDLVDILQIAKGWTKQEAIAHLSGQPVPVRPALQLVRPAPPPEDPNRIEPSEWRRLWDGMSRSDPEGERYLEDRGLGEAVGLGLVRFSVAGHSDKRVVSHARRGYRVAMALTDVVGNLRGIQMRLARPPSKRDEPKHISVKGSSPGRAFFGRPELVEAEPIVCVAEGMADTLAVASWASGRRVAVVGASGKANIHKLAKELDAAGVSVKDKLFLLFTQNDRPKNESRREFERLRQLLVERGAKAYHFELHQEFKDVADWLKAHPDSEWPPEQMKRLFGDEEPVPGHVQVEGTVVPIPAQVRSDHYAQDFTTLCTLLDDPAHREAVMGRGELSYCEMTGAVRLGGRVISEVDLSAIRLGLESQGRSTDGKPLKFGVEDIAQALQLLSRRKTVHPIRDWLNSLNWDQQPRLDTELPAALGHAETSPACAILRRWAISTVARAMQPGCKVDTVLVLVGPQGAGKSSFFSILGGDWFTDSPVNVGDKDGKMIMRQAWIVEWAELDAMKRARDQESIKAFLSARVDLFRKPYGRDVIEVKRGCVIVGTTNNPQFLADPTGNRRFWPVEVRTIDLDWLRATRDQLFAEAMEMYRAGEQWWLTPEEDEALALSQKEHEIAHPWIDLVGDWLDGRLGLEVSAAQVLIEALDKPAGQITHTDEAAVGRIMKQLGWRHRRKRFAGRIRWVYAKETV